MHNKRSDEIKNQNKDSVQDNKITWSKVEIA